MKNRGIISLAAMSVALATAFADDEAWTSRLPVAGASLDGNACPTAYVCVKRPFVMVVR